MPHTIDRQPVADVDLPPGIWQWLAGGLASVTAAGAATIAGLFKGQINEIKKEVSDLEKQTRKELEDMERRHIGALTAMEQRHIKHFDDLWEVINTERELASQARTRNYERLEQTPTRKEMNDAFERLGSRVDAALRDRRS